MNMLPSTIKITADSSLIQIQFLTESIVQSVAGGLIGILFGWTSTRRTSMLNPIDALRSE
ncbi:MAG: hypothetical protein ACI4EG_06135 [Fusicatenibacter sp.]